jgi:hypothetical protein
MLPSNSACCNGEVTQRFSRWFRIVGVVKDTKFYRLSDLPKPYQRSA